MMRVYAWSAGEALVQNDNGSSAGIQEMVGCGGIMLSIFICSWFHALNPDVCSKSCSMDAFYVSRWVELLLASCLGGPHVWQLLCHSAFLSLSLCVWRFLLSNLANLIELLFLFLCNTLKANQLPSMRTKTHGQTRSTGKSSTSSQTSDLFL